MLLPKHQGEKYCLEWTGSLGGGGRVSDVVVGGAADAASGGFWHNWLSKKNRKGLRELLLPIKSQGILLEALKKKRRKEQRVFAGAIAKEPGSGSSYLRKWSSNFLRINNNGVGNVAKM